MQRQSTTLRLASLLALALACTACPGPGQPRVGVKLPKQPDKYDQLAAVLTDQDKFTKELARLQGLYTTPPSETAAPRGDADARYSLTTVVEGTHAGIKLTDRYGGPGYTLWCWEEPEKKAALKLSRETPQADGLRMELSSVGGALSVTILARWVDARYLQVSREVLLGGLDMEEDLHAGACRWRISGPWLPYRIVPGAAGPYGVVPDAQADGAWHGADYPEKSMVPAVAAYSKTNGIWLASGDKGARDLTRKYALSWRIDPKYGNGELLELGYHYYDGVQDDYVTQHLVSGFTARDSVICEPFELSEQAIDQTLVEAETRQAIVHLGALARSFWFQPKAPQQVQPGSAVSMEEWVQAEQDVDEQLRTATGKWDAQLNEASLPDAKLGATGYGGIGAQDIGGGGLYSQAHTILAKLTAAQLPTLQASDFLHVLPDRPYAKALTAWLDGTTLNVRQPASAAWVLRKHCADLTATTDVAGYALIAPDLSATPKPGTEPQLISAPQAQAFTQLTLAEQISSVRPAALVATMGWPRLAVPVCANAQAISAESESKIDLGNRMASAVVNEVFGVEPWLAPSSTLAAAVLQTTAGIHGHAVPKALASFSGFDAFATNLDSLRKVGGDMQVLYSDPAKSAYTSLGERPAAVSKLIAVLPGNMHGARAVWVCFLGIGGAVSIDTYNKLTVTWPGGSWDGQLPGGIWKIEHPAPGQVAAGDAVLIKFQPIAVPTPDNSAAG